MKRLMKISLFMLTCLGLDFSTTTALALEEMSFLPSSSSNKAPTLIQESSLCPSPSTLINGAREKLATVKERMTNENLALVSLWGSVVGAGTCFITFGVYMFLDEEKKASVPGLLFYVFLGTYWASYRYLKSYQESLPQ